MFWRKKLKRRIDELEQRCKKQTNDYADMVCSIGKYKDAFEKFEEEKKLRKEYSLIIRNLQSSIGGAIKVMLENKPFNYSCNISHDRTNSAKVQFIADYRIGSFQFQVVKEFGAINHEHYTNSEYFTDRLKVLVNKIDIAYNETINKMNEEMVKHNEN